VVYTLILLAVQAIANLYLPALNADLINKGVATGNTSYIWHIGLWMLLSALLVMFASLIIAYLSARISMGFGRDVRHDVFTAVERFSARELNQFGAPSLITRNTNDVQQVQMVLFTGLTMMVSAPITGVGALIMAVKTNVQMSWILVVVIPITSLVIWLLLRRIVPLFRLMQVRIDRINLVLREQISGIRVIRAFVRTGLEESRFNDANTDLMDNTLKVTRTFSVMFPLLGLILNLSSVAVIWIGASLVGDGSMSIGNLTAFLAYLMQILSSVMMAVMMSLMIPRAATSAERIQEVLQTNTSVVESPAPVVTEYSTGLIEFRDVEFRYPGAQHPILENISFTSEPGKITAIVGSTGSGKTTLLNLITRFIDISGGSILVDGVDVRDQSLESLWHKIGLVPQRAFLFGTTLAENLRYGNADATEEQLWDSLEIAQAKDFVSELPAKLETVISQGGTNLSGGQRQRISIARALVKKSSIYLLDDSFSALDYSTDAKLRMALEPELVNSAVIIVGQRVSSIMHADQILVLDEGHIVGVGTHAELMESCKTYKEIVLSQLSPQEAS
jgi:ATP-binding cassette subfamily B protein